MRAFETMETFPIAGRGIAHIVRNFKTCTEDELIRELTGSVVLLDGRRRKVLGMESWLVPGREVLAGAPICLLFAEAVAEANAEVMPKS